MDQRSDVPSMHERIAVRAYELYEARGRVDGHDVQDWSEAEREIRSEMNFEPMAAMGNERWLGYHVDQF
jgi:DUF2934 family protein